MSQIKNIEVDIEPFNFKLFSNQLMQSVLSVSFSENIKKPFCV